MKLRSLVLTALLLIMVLVVMPVSAQPAAVNTVSYNGFSFSYDASLAGHVDIDEVAGDDPALQQPGGPEVKHVQFAISSSETPPSIFDAALAIRVYNTSDFVNYPDQTAQFQNLQNLLSAKTDLNTFMTSTDTTGAGNLPFIPTMPAAQVIRARAQYVETASVKGVSYITVYRQDVSPFTGSEFFYTFQGYSVDGVHYVSAIMKLNTGLFPAEIPADFNMDTFNAGFNDYLMQSVTTLNNAQPTDFTPSLGIFEAIIQSFGFASGSTVASASTPAVVPADPTFGGLTNNNWVLASYGSDEAPIPVLPEAPISLTFTQDGISGSSGCNTYFGQFQYDIDKLTFSGIGSTLVACPDTTMAQENAYLDALRTATSYSINNGVLRITYRDGVLTFNGSTAVIQVTPTPIVGGNATLGGLAGVNWVLSSFGPVAAPVAVIPGSIITATFTSSGVAGSAGCNSYNGNFTYDNGILTFTPFITTKMACADSNMMTQETTYLAALQSATGYQIVNGQLQIMYPDGVLTFNADTTPATPAVSLTSTPVINTDSSLGGLAGVQWILSSYGAPDAPVAGLPNAPITADFTAQGVSGSSGCNQYSGNFVYNNGTLTFSPLVSTQKACDQAIMDQEAAYLAALQGATRYQIGQGELQIFYTVNGADGVLMFKSA
ncbi:MAG: META domain-containing protein [Anaerolineaceae bacterium]|nr:META domain-containing protein [Anaerolineaceae bacterium]